MKPKDWTGIKVRLLTFIRPTDQRTVGQAIKWEALCECGNITIIVPRATNNKTWSCGCYGKKLRRLYDPLISSARKVWARYKKDGIVFDDFYRLSQQDCSYCGISPSNMFNDGKQEKRGRIAGQDQILHGDFIYNGLDRIDSSKGHTLDNVVPCCRTCNFMKNDMTVEEFLAHIEKIRNHNLKKV